MTEAALRERLTAQLAARLGIDPAEIDPREPFHSYGLGSAGAVGLIDDLSAELGRTLSPTLMWAYPTVEELARHLSAGESAPVRTAARVQARRSVDEPIAIVGMACRFPGAPDLQAFWRMLCDGVDATGPIPPDRWDADAWYHPDPETPGTINTRRGAFLDRIDAFDPLFFGISPREAAEMDPQQRLMLELAWEALEDAGIPPRSLAGTRTGVFVGVVAHDYAEVRRTHGGPPISHTGPGTSLSIVPNRISYLLGLRGPSLAVDTACSSSLVAVHLACRSLRDGESAVALAAGINLVLIPGLTAELTKFGLSGDGRCKAFDARADGFGRGEGGGVAVLKPLSRALADGDRIYCLIRGGAVNNDGASNGLTAPSPQAQVEVLQEAYARAGIDPGRVHYVETHGTGTPLGDPIEARALAAVLCADRDPSRPLAIGSVKTNIAHQESAAGIAGLIKLALAIHHRAIPPSLCFEAPNPDIPFEELRLRLQSALGPWPAWEEKPEPAVGGVSAFGWGGTNCHVVLEELREGKGPQGHQGLQGQQGPSRPWSPCGPCRPLVFVFSGMGFEWPGMGRDLLRSEPLFRARLERCDAVVRSLGGWSILEDLWSGGERWGEAAMAAPLVVSFQIALCDLWRSWGVEPAAVVGHSLGEMSAAYAAGVLSLEEAMRVAYWYGTCLRPIDGQGAMGAVALPPDEVRARIAAGAAGMKMNRLEVSACLSPTLTVVAGEAGEVDAFLARAKAGGCRFAARVPVAIPGHTSRAEPCLPELAEGIRGLVPRRPRLPIFSTVTGGLLDRPMDVAYWQANLRQTVLFAQAVEHLLAAGHDLFLEVDADPILATPLKQCFAASGVAATWLPSLRRGKDSRTVLHASAAALGSAGQPVRGERMELLPLSARTPEALRDLARATAGRLREPDEAALAGFAWTAAVRRTHHEHRLAATGRSRSDLAGKLEAFARGEEAPGVAAGRSRREPEGVVFVFSGQGPQWQGMGRQLWADEPVFRDEMERCDELFRPWLGESLLARLERDEDALGHTELAQPVLFALQVSLAALWRSWGVTPGAVVGHSVGEIAAAHAAGILSLEEAVRVAAVRGRAMEPARGQGGMVAVELPEEEVRAVLKRYGEDRLCIAAVNSPAAVTVAGEPAALDELMATLICRRLRVEYAFHSPQMEPYGREVEAALADLRPRPAAIPMVSSVTGAAVAGPDLDGAYWRRNVRQPVRFADAVGVLADRTVFLEIGPHPVLAAAVSQCLENAAVLASLRRGRDERETMLEALGSLYTLGYPVDWAGVLPDGGRLVRLPTYPFQRQRYWFETSPPGPLSHLPPTLSPGEGERSGGIGGGSGQEAPDASPLSRRGEEGRWERGTGGEVEQVLAWQLDAFQRMVALQLDALRQAGPDGEGA